MKKLTFKTAEQLRDFYLEQGYFAIYDCITEYGDIIIDHYSLLQSGEGVTPDCYANKIIDLLDERALDILERFLKCGNVKIHPSIFSIN